MARLPSQVAHARRAAPAFARLLRDIDPAAITSRAALARLPVTRKHELLERQKARSRASTCSAATPPSAGARRASPRSGAQRVFCSPGPIYEPEGRGADYWRMGRALFAAGLSRRRPGPQRFSYHFTPAGAMMDIGRARDRLHGLSGRDRADRDAGPGDRRHAARRLHRHAELPEADPSRRPTRLGIRPGLAEEGARSAARRFRRRCATGSGPRHRGIPELRHRRPRPRRLRDRGARRPGARRRRAARDRAAGHRRPGARRRGRRGRRDDASIPTTR